MKQLEIFEKSFGKKINRIGFGGIPIQGISAEESDALLTYALSQGINFIDTARGYSDSEVKIGRTMKSRRKGVFLATKSMARAYDAMKKDIETSLKNLKTNMIDLYQLHNVAKKEELDAVLDKDKGALRALTEARSHANIRFIGITSHTPGLLADAVKTGAFDSVQVPHNIIETGCEKEVMGICKELNIPVIAMKPIGGGALKEVAPLNLRYVLNHGSTIAVPGMDSIEYVDMNISVLPDIAPLTDHEFELLCKTRDQWQGDFCRRCGYCMPCPHGLNIPFLLLLKAYWERYDLKKWVKERIEPLPKKYNDCKKCGECTTKCPYSLPVKDMMETSRQWFETL